MPSPLMCGVFIARALPLMFPDLCREITPLIPTQVHRLRVRETSMSKTRLKPSLSSAQSRPHSFRPKALTVPSSPALAVAPPAAYPERLEEKRKAAMPINKQRQAPCTVKSGRLQAKGKTQTNVSTLRDPRHPHGQYKRIRKQGRY